MKTSGGRKRFHFKKKRGDKNPVLTYLKVEDENATDSRLCSTWIVETENQAYFINAHSLHDNEKRKKKKQQTKQNI